jgi:site-specific recombinase XerD
MATLDKLKNELKLRGFSEHTLKAYIRFNRDFLKFISKSPEDVNEDDLKSYLVYLLGERNNSNSSVALAKSALVFYYEGILGKKIDLKTPKIPKKLPTVMSKDEIKTLINKTANKKHKLLIKFLYSSGLRLGEIVN